MFMITAMAAGSTLESMFTTPVIEVTAELFVESSESCAEVMPVATTVAWPVFAAESRSSSCVLDCDAVTVRLLMSTMPTPSVVTAPASDASWLSLMPAALKTTAVLPVKLEPVKTRPTRFVICVEVRPELIAMEPVMPPTGVLRILR